MLIIVGSSGFAGFAFLSIAYKFETPAIVNVIGYSQIVFSFLSDLFIFHHEFHFMELIGCILICSGGFALTLSKAFFPISTQITCEKSINSVDNLNQRLNK